MKIAYRTIEGYTYSDIENYAPGTDVTGVLIREVYKSDFYSAKDGVTRHRLGRQWYKSPTGRYTVKLSESRSYDPEVPEVEIDAWENFTYEEQLSRFNIGGCSNSILEKVNGITVYSIEELDAKLKEIAVLVAELEVKDKIKADLKAEADRLAEIAYQKELDELTVQYLFAEALRTYNKAPKKKKIQYVEHVKTSLQKHYNGLKAIGMGYTEITVAAGKLFLAHLEKEERENLAL